MLRQHTTDIQIAVAQEYSASTWQERLDPRQALRRAFAITRPLTLLGLMMLLTLAAALIGLALDPRVITGAPAWLKPAKFGVSITLYSFTLLWMLSFVQGRPRLVSLVSNVTLIAFMVE